MNPEDYRAMYAELAEQNRRPEPFSQYTTDRLWTDPWIAQQMLKNHLDQSHDMASRRSASIDGIVDWLDRRLGLAGNAVCDLGCGPGLYATRMAQRDAYVTGVDFSAVSLDHARNDAAERGLKIDYWQADYLVDDLPDGQDLVTLIYGDFCTLSPDKRHHLLTRIKSMLKPGGALVFDVFTTPQFEGLRETATYGRYPMGDFWSREDHFGFQNTFLYPDKKISLDRYLIITLTQRFEIFNWMQYFDPVAIAAEVERAGFSVEAMLAMGTGANWTTAAGELAVVARR